MQLGGRKTSRAKGFFFSSPKGCSLCVCCPALLPSPPCKLHTSSYNGVLIPGGFPPVTSTPVPESVNDTGQLGTDTNSPRLWRLLVVAFTSLFHGQNTVESSREQLQWIISSWCSLREYLMAEMICSGMAPPIKSTDLLSPNIVVSDGHRQIPHWIFVFLHLGGLNQYSPVLASNSCYMFILWFQVIHSTCWLGSMSGPVRVVFPRQTWVPRPFPALGIPLSQSL